MPNQEAATQPTKPSWRIRVGIWMFYVPFVMFFGAPVVIPLLGHSASRAAAIIGAIVIAAEVIWFASIPLLGKEGFKTTKTKAFRVLKPREGPIGKVRHSFGVVLFLLSLLTQILLSLTVLIAYFRYGADPAVPILGLTFPEQAIAYAWIMVVAMAGLVISSYVLGADFWFRLKKAFEWPGEVAS